MIQNSRITRFAEILMLPTAMVAIGVLLSANVFSQTVNSEAFNESPDHSILESADERTEDSSRIGSTFTHPNPQSNPSASVASPESSSSTLRLRSNASTIVSPSKAGYDAPLAPQPRLTGSKPQSTYRVDPSGDSTSALGGDTSGTFASPNERAGKFRTSQSQSTSNVNSLRGTGLRPVPDDDDPSPQTIRSSTGSFSNSPAVRPNTFDSAAASTPLTATTVTPNAVTEIAGSNATARVDDPSQNFGPNSPQPEYESAYLHDQNPQADMPTMDAFGLPAKARRLNSPRHLPTAVLIDEAEETHSIQQTAYLSPATPAGPQQFLNGQYNNGQYSNGHLTQPQTTRQIDQRQRSQHRSQYRNQTQRGQQTRQQDLPRQNQRQENATSSTPSELSVAKEVVAKFSFEANQQSADGLPIRLKDLLQQTQGRADRAQVIPQYWEIYYDWAQSISAAHHRDWVASLNAAKQTDATTLEIAKSNGQNAITFRSIQLVKSQAKMKSLTGGNQPVIPMDSPTVTRVKTNYDAFKDRGMISPKFEGIDATLEQMYELIVSRANTVAMAEQNANEAKQLYASNQSTVDHLLAAGRMWRAAESDFIASVIEYNKAYADYALALPYGRGPVEAVVKMLIVKPTKGQTASSSQNVNGRPNLSHDSRSDGHRSNGSNQNSGDSDYSVPYTDSTAGSSVTSGHGNRGNHSGNNIRPASSATRSQPEANSFGDPSSAAGNLMQNARQQPRGGFSSNTKQAQQPTRTNAGASNDGLTAAGTNLIQRPSSFPSSQSAPPSANQFSPPAGQPNNPLQPSRRSFNDQRPNVQPTSSDKTATRANPFGSVRSADRPTATPSTTPKPPAGSGFSIGG